jgi:hypothetical protein
MLISELLEDAGHSSAITTVLIPDMNFTCCAKLVGFTFVGINRRNRGRQDPKIQIWRKEISEPGIYHKTGTEIAVNVSANGACADGLPTISSRTYFCVLVERFQVLIQPGDILGFELPPNDDDDFDIRFTVGGEGPTNYIFNRSLTSNAQLSERDLEAQQLPQLTFTLTKG